MHYTSMFPGSARPISGASGAKAMAEARCLWCEMPFEPRRGGSPQRFCRPSHRSEFHTATRLWAERVIASGEMTASDLRDGAGKACTLLSCAQTPVAPPEIGLADPALLTALHRLGGVVLRLPGAPEGIAELVRLGWLPRRYCHDPATVADAVIDLLDAALGARLRPR